MDRNLIPDHYLKIMEEFIPEDQKLFLERKQKLSLEFILPLMNYFVEATKEKEDKQIKILNFSFSGKGIMARMMTNLAKELAGATREEFVDLLALMLYLADYVGCALAPKPHQIITDEKGNQYPVMIEDAEAPKELEHLCYVCEKPIEYNCKFKVELKTYRTDIETIKAGFDICDQCTIIVSGKIDAIEPTST